MPVFGGAVSAVLLAGTDAGVLHYGLVEEVEQSFAEQVLPLSRSHAQLFGGREPQVAEWRRALALVWCCSLELESHGRALVPFVSSARHWQPGAPGAEGARLFELKDGGVELVATRALTEGEEILIDLGTRHGGELLLARGTLLVGSEHCARFHMADAELRELAAKRTKAGKRTRRQLQLLANLLGVVSGSQLELRTGSLPARTVSALRLSLADASEIDALWARRTQLAVRVRAERAAATGSSGSAGSDCAADVVCGEGEEAGADVEVCAPLPPVGASCSPPLVGPLSIATEQVLFSFFFCLNSSFNVRVWPRPQPPVRQLLWRRREARTRA
ncbi:hypothetical protein T492DRAFT_58475 [Pavlovales sp. CCMP2436]|nr:hypothetical protein T492DRAFT_58475 [Pavlovales sp. CCMP2436]